MAENHGANLRLCTGKIRWMKSRNRAFGGIFLSPDFFSAAHPRFDRSVVMGGSNRPAQLHRICRSRAATFLAPPGRLRFADAF
jgi:hypothetical protein